MARALLAAYVVVPALLVLGPLPVRTLDLAVDGIEAAVALLTGDEDAAVRRTAVEQVANVLVFVPIGALLPAALPRTSITRLLLACTCASLAIELYQAFVVAGRYASPRDVLLNSIGAALGAALHQVAARRHAGPASSPGGGPGVRRSG